MPLLNPRRPDLRVRGHSCHVSILSISIAGVHPVQASTLKKKLGREGLQRKNVNTRKVGVLRMDIWTGIFEVYSSSPYRYGSEPGEGERARGHMGDFRSTSEVLHFENFSRILSLRQYVQLFVICMISCRSILKPR
jgi:hypothetical protein